MKESNIVGTTILAGCLLLQLTTHCFPARGAAGDVDLSFDPGTGVNGTVNAIVLQPDGKVIIGGQFTTVRGLVRTNLARLNADGSGDSTFNPGPHDVVASLALQPDGKVLVGSQLIEIVCDEFDCSTHYHSIVTRLDPTGSLDAGFSRATVKVSNPSGVNSLVVQPDGKVLVGGSFSMVNGTNHSGITRLNANGDLDTSFNPGTGIGGWPFSIFSVAVQVDGKILIGGGFTTCNETNRNGLARLHADGSLDASFDPGAELGGNNPSVRSIVVQSDGKALIGGSFTNSQGSSLVRCNADGSLDTHFQSGTGAYNVSSLGLQTDGRVLIGADFTTTNGPSYQGIRRANSNGSLDDSFESGFGINPARVIAVIPQSDGKLLVAGSFRTVNVARLNADGGLDGSFNPGTRAYSSVPSLVVQPDGKVVIGGLFTFNHGTNRYGSARLNADGSADSTFVPDAFNPDLAAIFPASCPPGNICEDSYQVTAAAAQGDGRVLVSGSYFHLEYDAAEGFINARYDLHRLARFHANGSVDGSFTPLWNNGNVLPLAIQPDGAVLIGGASFANGTNLNSISRLNSVGGVDTSFNARTAVYDVQTASFTAVPVFSAAVQPDGKVLIGGAFTTVNGTNRNRIARLNADGSLDGSFSSGTGANGDVSTIVVQSDGKLLIGGNFTTVNGTNRNRIARLHPNGSLDSSFNPGTGADGWVRSIALQSDGNVLIGGDFLTINGMVRQRVARLYGDAVVAPSLHITRSNALMVVSWPADAAGYHLEESTNVALANSWSPVAQSTITNAGRISVTVSTTVTRFFRLKSP